MALIKFIKFIVPLIFSHLFVKCQIILTPKVLNLDGRDNLILIRNNTAVDNKSAINSVHLSLSFSYKFDHLLLSEIIHFNETVKQWTLPFVYHPELDEPLRINFIYMKVLFMTDHQQPYRSIIKKFSIKKYWGVTFFQTDKPIYRPNQVVRFRFIRLNENLMPINDSCTIIIKVNF